MLDYRVLKDYLNITKLRLAFVLVLVPILFSFDIYAQSTQTSDFEQWKKQSSQQFEQYVSAQDMAFSGFLKQKWIKASVTTDVKKVEKPKIVAAPIAPVQKAEPHKQTKNQPSSAKSSGLVQLKQTESDVSPTKGKAGSKPQLINVAPVALTTQALGETVEFLGHSLGMPALPVKYLVKGQPDPSQISNAWLEMSKHDSSDVLLAIAKQSKALNLDDWGRAIYTYQYIKQQVANQNVTADNSQLALYTWFYLVKQGLNARIAYDSRQIFLLLNTDKPLYAQKYFSFGGEKYYFVDFSDSVLPQLSKVFTYQKQHASGTSPLVFELSKVPVLASADTERKISFEYQQQAYDINVDYHKPYVEFLNRYPQLEVKHYFSTELSDSTKQSLLRPLAQIIEGKSEEDALNILLRFVQKGLAYQTDDQQFKQENFMFATEALHYPYADCEDRSVLFSYLVKTLTKNKIIGVLYKGHIATAVKLNTPIQGASYNVNGDKFYIADPTYIGADLGDVMPGYDKQSPRLIQIN